MTLYAIYNMKYKLTIRLIFIIVLTSVVSVYLSNLIYKLNDTQIDTYNSLILKNKLFQLNDDLILFVKSEHKQKFYEMREDKSANKIFSKIAECDELIDKLTMSLESDLSNTKYNFNEIKRLLKNFDNKYKQLINNEIEIGNKETGYIEEIVYVEKKLAGKIILFGNDDVKKAFDLIKQKRLLFSEKKSFNVSEEFTQALKKLSDKLSLLIADDTNNYGLRQIADAMSEYNNIFEIYKNLLVSNGTGIDTGIKGELFVIIDEIQFFLYDSDLQIRKNNKEKQSGTKYLIALIIFLYPAVVLSLIIISLKSFQYKIKILVNNLSSISEGKLDVQKINTRDEFKKASKLLYSHVKNLEEKDMVINEIISDNYDVEINLASKDDILGNSLMKLKIKLKEEENKHLKIKKEREITDKMTSELAKFGNILRQYTYNTEILAFELISNLVRFIHANIGGIYFLNETKNKKLLELKASYAFNQKKLINKTVGFGEGLVGTSAIEKTAIYLDKLPDDYLKIVTGFGIAKPKTLLIVPLIAADKVYGVIELASLSNFDKQDIKFVETLGIDIASTLSYLKT